MRAATAVAVVGVRGLQIAKFRSRLDRLPLATDVYDFSAERDRLRSRIAQLEAGEDVLLQAWELARELLPAVGLKSGFDRSGPKCFRIVGDELMPEDYEKVSTSPPDPKVVVGQAPSHWHPFRAKAAPLRKADKVVRLPAYTVRPATQAG